MTIVHLVIMFTIGGIAILNAVLFWFMPRLTRRDLYFAVTVAPAFRDEPEGRSILGRYRAELIFFSALALAAFVAGTAWLCVGFVSTGTFLQLVASFIAFFLDFLGEQAMNALSSSIFDLRLGSWHDRESIDEVLFVAKCRLR
jgi:hypothetical protein